MIIKNINSEIFIGKGAGKDLLEKIANAKKSIKIVSPYLSPNLISELIELKKRNINIKLITTDKIEDYKIDKKKNIYKLIIQERILDIDAERKSEKAKDLSHILKYIGYGIIALSIVLFFFYQTAFTFIGFITATVILLIHKYYESKFESIRIYNYRYSQLFPFKVFMSPYKDEISNTFIHSKIYIIDDKTAFLGSLNFTFSGTEENYETIIKIKDIDGISKIMEEVERLFNSNEIPTKDIQEWGSEIYDEPIN